MGNAYAKTCTQKRTTTNPASEQVLSCAYSDGAWPLFVASVVVSTQFFGWHLVRVDAEPNGSAFFVLQF
jgi:hypothetical protein